MKYLRPVVLFLSVVLVSACMTEGQAQQAPKPLYQRLGGYDAIAAAHISCYGYPTANRFTSPPFQKGGELVRSMIFRVPVDDATTLLYFVRFAPDGEPGLRTSIRDTKYGEYTPLATDWWGIDVNDQDRMAVEQQGAIADRPHEHLGVSDCGIIAMRQMMRESLAAVAEGKDPLCIIRDPAKQRVDFPVQASMTKETNDDVGYGLGYGKEVEKTLA